ncbi:hypothetical protein RvY_04978-1 [Ramazzottius varieornatus]|uniref:Uncharacterized protein n=1 Tax=Ramazzottius varieornatus TaxID=947166 RepID=A0A1D1UTI9_RAMVA|nr:hypothetical protein RvY_04978-1 [Ramazzottius varieornatus]
MTSLLTATDRMTIPAGTHSAEDTAIPNATTDSSRSRSSPYSSRDSRHPYEKEEQRLRLGLYPESSSRRYDTRDSEAFVDTCFRKSRCPQLRDLSRQSGKSRHRMFLLRSQMFYNCKSALSACKALGMEANNFVLMALDHDYPTDQYTVVPKRWKFLCKFKLCINKRYWIDYYGFSAAGGYEMLSMSRVLITG